MKKRKLAFSIALAGMLTLAGCSEASNSKESNKGSTNNNTSNNQNSTSTEFKFFEKKANIEHIIAILQFGKNEALDEATNGYYKQMKDAGFDDGLNTYYDIQVIEDEEKAKRAIAHFVKEKADVIFANGTVSALSALQTTKDVPIIFTSVQDPLGAGIVESYEKPGNNIAGVLTNDNETTQMIVDFMTSKVGTKKIGVLSKNGNKAAENEVRVVEESAQSNGASVISASFNTVEEISQAIDSLGEVDSLYLTADELFFSAIDSIVKIVNEKKIPLFTSERTLVKNGAFASAGFDPFHSGYEAGNIALELIRGGKTTTDFSLLTPPRTNLLINKKAAENQGVQYNVEWEADAEVIEVE
jgi:putative tryptophan/tyrosine transport system substrate-binding protein